MRKGLNRAGRRGAKNSLCNVFDVGAVPLTAAAVETVDLSRRFGKLVAVDRISFGVQTGSVFGLLGPNGAGKSCTIKMLTTLLPPTGGSARVAGYDVVREPHEVRRRIGYVPQMPSTDGDLTGRENLKVMAELYSVPRSEERRRIDESLRLMELSSAADTLVKNYSGGMIRRLEIAQSMLHEPAILFLDEPTIGLDPAARAVVWDHVRALRAKFNVTIFLTTHYMEEAEELCDCVAFLHRGSVARIGAPADLRAAVGANATLDDVFIALAEDTQEGGDFADALRARRAAQYLE